MKKQQRDAFRVHHMVAASEAVLRFVQGKQLKDLLADELLASGVERQLEKIGEAAGHISAESQVEWPEVSWRQMKNARNFIAHEYFRPDYAKIWHTVEQIIPHELPLLKEVLAELETRFGTPEDDV